MSHARMMPSLETKAENNISELEAVRKAITRMEEIMAMEQGCLAFLNRSKIIQLVSALALSATGFGLYATDPRPLYLGMGVGGLVGSGVVSSKSKCLYSQVKDRIEKWEILQIIQERGLSAIDRDSGIEEVRLALMKKEAGLISASAPVVSVAVAPVIPVAEEKSEAAPAVRFVR